MMSEFTKKKKVLVYRLGSLGDTIMVLPCFHKIKEVFQNADITLLTNQPVAAKAAPVVSIIGSEFFSRQITYAVGTRNIFTLLKIILQIRKLKIDLLINVTAARTKKAAIRDKWFFKLAGIKHFIGFPEQPDDFTPIVNSKTGELEWEASRLTRRLKVLGEIDLTQNRYWDLLVTPYENMRAKNFLHNNVTQPLLVISPGTKMQSKDWEENNWVNLLSLLGKNFKGHKLAVIGAPDEKTIGEKCCTAWGNNAVNLCGLTSPRESAAVLKYAKIFIGHDSGPMHLAAAGGTPCVAIFAARNLPRQWFPRGDNNRIMYHKTDCAGCNLETCIIEKKKCILSITVEEVYNAVTEILAQPVITNKHNTPNIA